MTSALFVLLALGSLSAAQPPDAEDRERLVIERMLESLEKAAPRADVLDHVYGYHVERQTVEALFDRYRKRVTNNSKDGRAWLLLGLFEAQRGQYGAAADALDKAVPLLPEEGPVSFHRGRILVQTGRVVEAVAALEVAVARPLPPTDLLNAYQSLRRAYQQLDQADKAAETLARVRRQFATNSVVQRQIAGQLAEENRYAEAREIYHLLAKMAADPLDRAGLLIAAADLAAQQGLKTKAVEEYEGVLNILAPDSAAAADARRRLEEVFLRDGDAVGVVRYYEARLKPGRESPDVLARLARILALQNRVADARTRLEQATTLAPARTDLRAELIQLLVSAGDIPAAIRQYERLNDIKIDDKETLTGWGELLLRDPTRTEADRRTAAAQIWRRIADADDTRKADPLAAIEAAGVFARAGMSDEALTFHGRAVTLRPDNPEYRRQLGEYLLSLKRPAEAIAVWREIAAGPRRTPDNLARLADLLAGAGFPKEAVGVALEARSLTPGSLDARLRAARLLAADGRSPEALAELDAAVGLAKTPEQDDEVVRQQIEAHQSGKTLDGAADRLATEVTAAAPDPRRWLALARFREAQQRWPDALAAVGRARDLAPKSHAAWRALARVAESAGDLARAAEAFQRLAEIDSAQRLAHLRRVTELSAQLGQRASTLQAGQQLLAAAGAEPDLYQLVAAAYFRVGAVEEGEAALRLGVIRNPGAPQPLIFLAAALTERGRTAEALALSWRAFDKTDTGLDDRLALVDRLAELSARTNQFEGLLARLTAFGQAPDRRREAAFYLARAYQKNDRTDKAQAELDRLLTQPGNDQDTLLLQQLVALAEGREDWPAATGYQKRLVRLVRSAPGRFKLAELLDRIGEYQAAADILAGLAANQQDAPQVLATVDTLLFHNQSESALRITSRLLVGRADNWELLYREGLALTRLKDRRADAVARFQAILALTRPDDEPSVRLQKESTVPAASAPVLIPTQERLMAIPGIRAETGLAADPDDPRRSGRGPTARAPINMPVDFRQARLAATGWLLALAREEGREAELAVIGRFRQARALSIRAGWDWFYLNQLLQNEPEAHAAALALSRDTDLAARWMYLCLFDDGRVDLDHRLACYKTVRDARPDWLGEADRVGGLRRLHADLRVAGRGKDADALYTDLLAAARPATLEAALQIATDRRDVDGVIATWGRLLDLRGLPPRFDEGPAQQMRDLMRALPADEAGRLGMRRLLNGLMTGLRKSPGAATPSAPLAPRLADRDTANFPAPNRYFPGPALALFREVYQLHGRAGRASDLIAHFRIPPEKASAAERAASRLSVGYLLWWSGDRPGALVEVTAAAEADPGLRLDVAELLIQSGRIKEALAEAEKDTSVDPDTVRRREWVALRAARRLGEDARARIAAARLAAIRLDTEEALRLAQELRQLKLVEPAEDVLVRVLGAARGRPELLFRVMEEFLSLGRRDRAVAVATEIVRLNPSSSQRDRDVPVGQQALNLLTKEGKLAGLIADLEAEAARNPRYRPPLDILAGLYRSTTDIPNLRRTLRRAADLSPGDPAARGKVVLDLNQFGDDLERVKNLKAARAAYEAAVAEWDEQHPGGAFLASDRRTLVTILTDAASAAIRLGDRPAAVAYLNRAEAATDRPAELVKLAAELRVVGLKDETRPILARAMKLFAASTPEQQAEIAFVFNDLIDELRAQGMSDRTAETAVLALRAAPSEFDRGGPDRFGGDLPDRMPVPLRPNPAPRSGRTDPDRPNVVRSAAVAVLREPANKPRLGDLIRTAEAEYLGRPSLPPLLALEGLYRAAGDIPHLRDTLRRIAKSLGDSPAVRLAVVRQLNRVGDELVGPTLRREAYEAAVAEWDLFHPGEAIPEADRGFLATLLADAAVAAATASDRAATAKYLKRAETAEVDPAELLELAIRVRKAGLADEARPLLERVADRLNKEPRIRAGVLVLLMNELETQGLLERAAEVAVRVLTDGDDRDVAPPLDPTQPSPVQPPPVQPPPVQPLSPTPPPFAQPFSPTPSAPRDRGFDEEDAPRGRVRAAAVLRKSGKLPKLIAAAEAEYKAKPGQPVLRRLEAMYRANEDVAGLRGTLGRMANGSGADALTVGRDIAYLLKQFGDELKARGADRQKVREAYEAAIAEWDERVKGQPIRAVFLTDAARACQAAGDLPTARKYLARAETAAAARVKAEPDNDRARQEYVEILENVAEIARQNGAPDEVERTEKQVLSVYRSWAANPPKDQSDLKAIGKRLMAMAGARQKQGDGVTARTLQELRAQMFEKAATPGQANPELLDALVDLAAIESQLRGRSAAGPILQKAVALSKQWVDANPNSDQARLDHEWALRQLSEHLRLSGDLAGAGVASQAAVDITRPWATQDPAREIVVIELGEALHELARVRRAQRRLAEARDLATERARVLDQALALNLDSTKLADSLATAYEDLGRMVEFPETARDAWRKALGLHEQRLRQTPNEQHALERVAEAHEWLGDLEDRLGNLILAVEHCRKAVELKVRIAADKPDARARSSLGFAYQWLGKVSGRAGDLTGAIAQYREELEVRETLLKEFPNNERYRKYTAQTYQSLGDALVASGDPGAALGPLEKSIALLRGVRDIDDTSSTTPAESLTSAISRLATARLSLGDIAGARGEYRKALDLVEAAVKEYPGLPGPRISRASHLRNMGAIALIAGDFAEAEKWYAQAVQQLEGLDKEKLLSGPDDAKLLPDARRNLAVARQAEQALRDLAFAAMQQTREVSGDLLRFRAAALTRAGDLKAAVETAEALRGLGPKDAETLFETARCYGQIATLIAKGRPPGTLPPDETAARADAVRKSLEALKAAVAVGLPDRRRVMTSDDLNAVRAEPGYRDLVATFAGSPNKK